ncbi:MAG TPA: cytochrome c [Candidatus Sulfotelmatobacter sp.]|nr:cytochrome c [Candidatus Sulfotelmatobacter sp.]
MKERWLAVVVIALALTSCGKSQNSGSSEPATPSATSAAPAHPESTAAVPAVSKYDSGPRASEHPVDQGLAAKGKILFTARGCVACHAFGKVLTCPDLVGVPHQRSAEWMTQQILHPDVMVKEDPITMELRTHYKLPMTNQNVKPDEAKALIEYIKSMDKPAN